MQGLEHLESWRQFAAFAAATVTELIGSINAANTSAGADTISLAPGATFSLSTVHNAENGPNGLPRITDKPGLAILAPRQRSSAPP